MHGACSLSRLEDEEVKRSTPSYLKVGMVVKVDDDGAVSTDHQGIFTVYPPDHPRARYMVQIFNRLDPAPRRITQIFPYAIFTEAV